MTHPAGTLATLAPLALFAIAASFSPGPNNIMAMGMSARVGFRRTIPFGTGVVVGFFVMVAAVGIGLGVPLARHPALLGVMRWAGAIWLLVLAWKIGNATAVMPADAAPADALPADALSGTAPVMGFWGAAGFQWVNPKAWIMAVAAAAAFGLAGLGPVGQSLLRAAVFAVVGVCSMASWMLLGLGVGRFLTTTRSLRRFNIGMGVLLALSVVPAVLE